MTKDALFELRSTKASLRMRLGKWLISRQPRIFTPDPDALRQMVAQRDDMPDAPLPEKIAKRFRVEEWDAAGHTCITLHPAGGDETQHILYFHGGGFIFPMFDVHWPLVAQLAESTGSSITVPLYPIVPETSSDEAMAQADAAYAQLAGKIDSARIVLAGDSAGAHMALTLAGRLKSNGGPMPGGLLLFSPLLDITLADPEIRDVEPYDIMLAIDSLRVAGEWWAGEADPAAPEYSPLNADPAGLPPTVIFQGRHDIFVTDARTYTAKAKAAGNAITLYEYAGAPHVYMLLGFAPEAKDTMALARDFVVSTKG